MVKGFAIGVVVTVIAVAAVVYVYFATGMAPVATSAAAMPFEKKFARMALHAVWQRKCRPKFLSR